VAKTTWPGVGEQPPGHGHLGDVEVAVGERHQHTHGPILRDATGRVVRAAQQVGGAAAARDGPAEGLLQGGEVDAPVRAERSLAALAVHVLDELEEGRIHGRVDDHGVAGSGDQLQHLDDAQHHVGHDRRALHREPAPPPPLVREPGQRLGVGGAGRVSGVPEFERPCDRGDDGSGEGHVHLGHPQRQHVGRVNPPFHARTASQAVEGECAEGVRFTGRSCGILFMGHKIGRRGATCNVLAAGRPPPG
jgi:hypothetical protein